MTVNLGQKIMDNVKKIKFKLDNVGLRIRHVEIFRKLIIILCKILLFPSKLGLFDNNL